MFVLFAVHHCYSACWNIWSCIVCVYKIFCSALHIESIGPLYIVKMHTLYCMQSMSKRTPFCSLSTSSEVVFLLDLRSGILCDVTYIRLMQLHSFCMYTISTFKRKRYSPFVLTPVGFRKIVYNDNLFFDKVIIKLFVTILSSKGFG